MSPPGYPDSRAGIDSDSVMTDLKGQADVAQLVAHNLAKVGVASSNLVVRS